MKYIPYLYSLDGELLALENQTFSDNIIPFINIVKDKKTSRSSKSVLDDLEKILLSKSSNTFLINIPMNLDLSKKRLKKPIEAFYKEIYSNYNYQISILNRFSNLSNVIPVIDIPIDNYNNGDLKKLRSKINASKVAFIIYAKKSQPIFSELSNLISSEDLLIYDLSSYDFFKKSIKDELKQINKIKQDIKFKSIVIKQIYNNLTFFKLPNGEITSNCSGYDCIDSDFYNDFPTFDFEYFGDFCGIRNTPIYDGGLSYPSFIGLHPLNSAHFGFTGIEKDVNSHETTLLPNILNSDYWNDLLSLEHKTLCFGCSKINSFNNLTVQKNKGNPINNATTWKAMTIAHYLSMMDYKLKNSIIS